MNDAVHSWLLFPVYVWQGIGIRGRIERMLPPAGPTHGAFGLKAPDRGFEPPSADPAQAIAGAGNDPLDALRASAGSSGDPAMPAFDPAQPRPLHEPPHAEAEIRLLVVGDSSAAGVGVDRVEDGLACRLAERLHVLTGRPVRWRAIGSNSAVSSDLRDFIVPNLAREPYTHILLTTGTNDVKNFHTARRFKRGFGGLLYALRARWPDARIVWSPPVDMLRVPALPPGLARVLDLRARILERLGARLCRERGVVPATTLPRVEPAGFSRDGFHASAPGADYAAGHLAPYVLGDQVAG